MYALILFHPFHVNFFVCGGVEGFEPVGLRIRFQTLRVFIDFVEFLGEFGFELGVGI